MNLTPLKGYKTYVAAALAIAGAASGAADGDITWIQAIQLIVPAVLGMTLRHGISTHAASMLRAVADAAANVPKAN